ncbi:hypothetical protein [Saccharothrix stipae]
MLVDQAVERVLGGAGEFLRGRTHRLGDQIEAGQVTHGGQDPQSQTVNANTTGWRLQDR